jgi:hypothetical protein
MRRHETKCSAFADAVTRNLVHWSDHSKKYYIVAKKDILSRLPEYFGVQMDSTMVTHCPFCGRNVYPEETKGYHDVAEFYKSEAKEILDDLTGFERRIRAENVPSKRIAIIADLKVFLKQHEALIKKKYPDMLVSILNAL